MKPRTRADIIGWISIAVGSVALGGLTHNAFWALALIAFTGVFMAMIEEEKSQ